MQYKRNRNSLLVHTIQTIPPVTTIYVRNCSNTVEEVTTASLDQEQMSPKLRPTPLLGLGSAWWLLDQRARSEINSVNETITTYILYKDMNRN